LEKKFYKLTFKIKIAVMIIRNYSYLLLYSISFIISSNNLYKWGFVCWSYIWDYYYSIIFRLVPEFFLFLFFSNVSVLPVREMAGIWLVGFS